MSLPERMLLALGALSGLLGVALSAAAAHVTGSGSLQIAAQFLLFHAPVLLAMAALVAGGFVHPKIGRLAGYVLVVGLILFCGDLSRRALSGEALAPMAAPTGGVLLMLGWILIAAAGFVRPRA
ncbi:DUF423 domain-containing protein [Microvirga antarctica]|uniref:DUF423 domain-containing protein n=1 Tax=Microvirga antarctica TaxID=2819233 RepID=UPI001B30914B|nr:DUF423 domain-containing protein [Microvirga antarctica]